ncbi:MAG TPA: hypothetical protein VI653_23115 [Steroidobacteraceae bacterium]
MAKQSGLGDALIVGGNVISGDVNAIGKISGGPAAMDFTGIDKFAHERQGELKDGSLDFTAFYNDTAVTGAHAILKTLPTADTLVTYLRGSTVIGGQSACLNAKQVNYDGTRAQNGAFTLAVNAIANSYGLEWGIQLTAGMRTDTTATNGASFDYGSVSTAFGMQAYLQISSVVGTSVTVAVQDSADNISFANITGLSFTAVAPGGAPGFQRLATANNATIRRYLRIATTGTFSSAVFQVTAQRNETLTAF